MDHKSTRRILTRREFILAGTVQLISLAAAACRPKVSPDPLASSPTPTFSPSATPAPSPTITPTSRPEIPLPDMTRVEGSRYLMGSEGGDSDESPVHEVLLDSFWIGTYPVTFQEYDLYCQLMKKAPPPDESWGRGKRPVIHITWNAAAVYCNWLSEQHGYQPCFSGNGKAIQCDFTQNGYRLPTEAEWEYTARGGNSGEDNIYSGGNQLVEFGWFQDNAAGQTQPVGLKQPNPLGLYDLSGNVWEWCYDKYLDTYYQDSPVLNPIGPDAGKENKYLGGWERSRRGGAYNEAAASCRITNRSFDGQAYEAQASGFRLVRSMTKID